MNKKAEFSIVVPSYMHESYIGQAIESALRQTYRACEIIVIDDGSNDGSVAIAEGLSATWSGIKVLTQDNQGAHRTINRAIGMAKGQYVAILNSDDLFIENKLDRCNEIFCRNPDVDLIFGEVMFVDDRTKGISRGVSQDWMNRSLKYLKEVKSLSLALLHENFAVTTSNMVFKKKLWMMLGGFANLRYCHDYEFITRATCVASVYFDREKHIKYRIHPKNTLKESAFFTQVEIASVLAASISEYASHLVLTPEHAESFSALLRSKNFSHAVILLMAELRRLGNDRALLFARIQDLDFREKLVKLIGTAN